MYNCLEMGAGQERVLACCVTRCIDRPILCPRSSTVKKSLCFVTDLHTLSTLEFLIHAICTGWRSAHVNEAITMKLELKTTDLMNLFITVSKANSVTRKKKFFYY